MTDTPRRFPYGGGPARSRWINPKLVDQLKARGVELAELPDLNPVYFEPSYDDMVDDGSASVHTTEGETENDSEIDLDFDAEFRPSREAVTRGIPAGEHLEQREREYAGWECDCRSTAKTGIPPRHYRQYFPELVWAEGPHWRVMIAPGKGEIKQAKGDQGISSGKTPWVECSSWVPSEATLRGWICSCPNKSDHRWDRQHVSRHGTPGAVMLPDYWALREAEASSRRVEAPRGTECPTWRLSKRRWTRPERDWRKLAPSLAIAVPAQLEPPVPVTHPAGPIGEPEFLHHAELPRGCTAKTIILTEWTTSQLKVSGRQVDDGPVVERYRVAGERAGRRWVAYWTEGKFDSAVIDRRPAKLAELRKFLKGTGDPTLFE